MPVRRALLIVVCVLAILLVSSGRGHAETIGVIITHGESYYERIHQTLVTYLNGEGYGKRVKFLVQRPYPDPIAWSNASRKLIAADVDVIVTYGTPATLAAVKERTRIPILSVGVYEPVAEGITAKNVTGVCARYQVSSLVRYLRGSTTLKDLGVVYSSLEEDSRVQLAEIKKIAQRYDFAVTELNVRNPVDIAGTLSGVEVSALFVTSSSLANSVYATLLRISESRRIPTASLILRDDLNATMALSSNPEKMAREAAGKLVKLLEGVPPRDIPLSCAKDIELVVNLRDARSLGMRVSMDLVIEATKVIY